MIQIQKFKQLCTLTTALLCFSLASCEPKGRVLESSNEFGGQTLVEENFKKSRLKLRKVYFDGAGVKRKEDRYPVDEAIANLGFSYQQVTYDDGGKITADLREAPEDLPNEFGYLSFLRTYGPGKKILTGEVVFKTAKAKKIGYTSSIIHYNQKGRPEKVFYYDLNKKLIYSGPAK